MRYLLSLCFLSYLSVSQAQVNTLAITIPEKAKIHAIDDSASKALIATPAGEVQLFDLKENTGTPFGNFSQAIRLAAFSPDGQQILTNTGGKEAQLWSLAGERVATLQGHLYDITCLAFSPGGQLIATGSQDQQVILWNARGQKVRGWEASDFPILALAFSPDGQLLVSGGADQRAKVWNLQGELRGELIQHQGSINCLAFAPDGAQIASGGADQAVKLWGLSGEEARSIPTGFVVAKIAYLAEGAELLAQARNGQATRFDARGEVLEQYSAGSRLYVLPERLLDLDKAPELLLSEADLPEMVLVQGGRFQMGSEDGGKDEKPVHTVELDDFYVSKYEVTQKQWREVMGENPSEFKNCDDCPVEQVSWEDVQEFLKKLNAQTGQNYRLPTEAEWEYAARGGQKSQGYEYAGSNDLDKVAWYDGNSGYKTHPVGQKQPNELGLYDMSGNVWEWCQDAYDADFYGTSAARQRNPINNGNLDSNRCVRGGSWYLNNDCRSSYRGYYNPRYDFDNLGFRLFRTP